MQDLKILLIEDDFDLANSLVAGLAALGHSIDWAPDGLGGLKMAVGGDYDVLIVDRMLPGTDGLSLVKSARASGADMPILFLTALTTVGERVAGLEGGGDDYLGKPFSFEELHARIRALVRRSPNREKQPHLRVGALLLDRIRRQVSRNGQVADLQQREIRILEVLMLNAGEVVTRTMLLEQVWDFKFDPGTNIVESHISRIRSKIDVPGEVPLIQTVRGAGYVLRSQ